MSALNRRTFLAGTAAAGLVAATSSPSFAAAPAIRTVRESHRVVVIGSGFGGGITALRLATAGVPVLVLERGIRWPTGPNAETFPHQFSPDRRVSWLERSPVMFGAPPALFAPFTGLFERVRGNNQDIMCAAGVGGGSLVYQGMSLQPSQEVFNHVLPEQLDYAKMDRVYYRRVESMLKLQTVPDDVFASPSYRASRIFKSRAEQAGMTVSRIPMPIDWNYARRELRGEMKPSYTTGDVVYGVNNGGKNSVDVTYLAAAEATGRVTVEVLHNVTDVSMTKDGGWVVEVDRIDTSGRVLEKKIITTKALVMAAGSAGTVRLLMRAQGKGLIPDLPDGLGTNWGTNGDKIYAWSSLAEDFGAYQGGPVTVGTKDWKNPATANTLIQAGIPLPADLRTTTLVGYGVSTSRGRFRYDARTDDAILDWPANGDAELHTVIRRRADAIVGPSSSLLDVTAIDKATWHPLGGAAMGSVCDLAGRVQGHRGLYVLDGALIPGSTGACNPSMTIAAVVERATDELIAHDIGTAI